MNGNGGERLDRIERLLENLAERQESDHEFVMSEIKSMLKWQVLTQGQIDEMVRSQKAEREASQVRDERVDKLVSAIGRLIERMPPAPGGGEAGA
jgi:hypothetical protein